VSSITSTPVAAATATSSTATAPATGGPRTTASTAISTGFPGMFGFGGSTRFGVGPTTSVAPSFSAPAAATSLTSSSSPIGTLIDQKVSFTKGFVEYMIQQPPRVVNMNALDKFTCTYAALDNEIQDLEKGMGKNNNDNSSSSKSITPLVVANMSFFAASFPAAPSAAEVTKVAPSPAASIAFPPLQQPPSPLFTRSTFPGYSSVPVPAVDQQQDGGDYDDTTPEDADDGKTQLEASAEAAEWNTVYTVSGANFLKQVDNVWKNCCSSDLKLERKIDNPNLRRMIMRTQGVGKLVLNVGIVDGMPFREGNAKKDGTRRSIMFANKNGANGSSDPPVEMMMISVSAASYDRLNEELRAMTSK
jgi:hypothetical protein